VPDLVPVVDLTAPDAPQLVDAACRSVGFMSIVGHDVPRAAITTMLDATDELFALPLEEKLQLRSPNPRINRGYAPKGTEGLAYSLGVDGRPPDLFEAFNIGPEHRPEGVPADRAEFAPNVWPDRPAALRPALVAYFEEIATLARRLTGVMACALELDDDFFVDRTDHSTDTLRVIHYERPPGEPEPLPGQHRMGAHTDYGILTILFADRVPGLEIVGPEGGWHGIVPPPDGFLVNLGDLLARWTNDRWRSTMHRVVPPEPAFRGRAVRRSMAFFHDGNFDALIECLPTCSSEDNPPRYPPVIAGDHLLAKLLGPRTLTVSDAQSTAGERVHVVTDTT
jgi:isopenicillin N synthase-like dioxygenase